MANGVTATLVGAAEVTRRLKLLPPAVQKKVGRRAFTRAARSVLAAARANVPVLTGTLRRNLKSRAFRRTRTGRIGRLIRTPLRSELGGRHVDEPGYYPAVVEYGAAHVPARPFLRPALESNRTRVFAILAEEFGKGIRDEARKLGAVRLATGIR